MTRSIFDPTGGETEHSGSTFTGPAAGNDSHMPSAIANGEIPDMDGDIIPDMDMAGDDVVREDGNKPDRSIGVIDGGLVSEMGTNVIMPIITPEPSTLPPRRGNEGEQ